MGIQINGQTDIISAIDGSLTIQGASGNLTGDLTGNVTGNVTGNINSTGVSTFSTLLVGTGVTISGGIVTATSFRGDGSALTGIAATTNVVTNSLVVSGVTTVAAGSTAAPSISPTGDSNTGIFFPSADTIAFGEGGTEALRIDNSGRVGIGTDNPLGSLQVGAGTSTFIVTGIGSIGIGTINPLGSLHVNANSSPSIVFAPRFSSAHSLSVGAARTVFMYVDREPETLTWSDASNRDKFFHNSLYVRTPVRDSVNNPAIVIAENGGQATGRNSLVFWNDDLNGNSGYIKSRIYTQVGGSYNSTQFFIDVADSSRNIQNRFSIDVSGNFSGSASNDISDRRLKQNIQTITNSVDKIKALTGRTFEWQERASMALGTKYGFIAQEVEEVIPELVLNESGIRVFDENDNLVEFPDLENGTTNYSKSVQSSGITPILVEALKEAIARIETLEARLDAAGL